MQYWIALLVIASVWFAHLCVSYFLAWADCATTQPGLLMVRHVATALGLTLIIALSIRARSASAAGRVPTIHAEPVLEHKFFTGLTVTLGAMFLFGVVLAGAANFFLGPCV